MSITSSTTIEVVLGDGFSTAPLELKRVNTCEIRVKAETSFLIAWKRVTSEETVSEVVNVPLNILFK